MYAKHTGLSTAARAECSIFGLTPPHPRARCTSRAFLALSCTSLRGPTVRTLEQALAHPCGYSVWLAATMSVTQADVGKAVEVEKKGKVACSTLCARNYRARQCTHAWGLLLLAVSARARVCVCVCVRTCACVRVCVCT